jgi:hypothetical protein
MKQKTSRALKNSFDITVVDNECSKIKMHTVIKMGDVALEQPIE